MTEDLDFEAAARSVTDMIEDRVAPFLDRMHGTARQCMWLCEDDWIVIYTTTRIEGGPHDGKFLAQLFKPTGPGARTGTPNEWREAKRRVTATRNVAKKRATSWYYQHSPKTAQRHGKAPLRANDEDGQ